MRPRTKRSETLEVIAVVNRIRMAHGRFQAGLRRLGSGRRVVVGLVLLGLLWCGPAVVVAQPQDPDAVGIIWVGTSAGLFKVDAQTGSVILQTPGPLSPSQLAVDWEAEILWATTEGTLHALDFQGQELFTVTVPAAGPAIDLLADPNGGMVSVVVGMTIYHFDTAGQPLGSFTALEPIVGIGRDRWNDLWVAHPSSVVVYDQSTGTIEREADLGKGKVTLVDMYFRNESEFPFPSTSDADHVYLVSSDKGYEDFAIFSYYTNPADSWAGRPRDVHSAAYRLSASGSEVEAAFSPGGILANPLQSPITQLVDENLEAWIGGGSEIARMDFGAGSAMVVDLGAGVEITALAANEREHTSPHLFVTSEKTGAWVNQNPPTFDFSFSDWTSTRDLRKSGVDPSTLTSSWMYSEQGHATGALSLTCNVGSGTAQCTPTQAVEEGLNRFEANVVDYAGNSHHFSIYSSDALLWEVTIDSVPPIIDITIPAEGADLVDRSPPIELTYSDSGTTQSGIAAGSLALFANDVTLPVSCSGNGSPTTCDPLEPLPVGPVTLRAEVDDVAGGTGTDQIQVTVTGEDTFAPVLTVLAPGEGEERTPGTLRIDLAYTDLGQGIDPGSLSVLADGAPLAVTCSQVGSEVQGELRCVPDAQMPTGPVSLEITLGDLAGNSSASVQRSFTVVPRRRR